MDKMENEEYVNERLMKIDWTTENKQEYTLIIAYGPNEDDRIENKEKFFKEIQKIIDKSNKNIIIMGDLNGRVGRNNNGIERYMGKEGEHKNSNGEKIIELCIENDLIIANTFYTHKDIHKFTREQPSRNEKSIIDYFLINKTNQHLVKDVRVHRGPEINSDHYLVILKLKAERKKEQEARKTIIKEKIRTYRLLEEK